MQKKVKNLFFRFLNNKNEYSNLSNEKFFKIFEADKNESPYEVSNNFEKRYSDISKNLFNKKFLTALDIGKKRSLDKLNAMLEKVSKNYVPYIKDIIYVLEKLDAIPGGYLKMIRNIKLSDLSNEMKKLYSTISPEYLKKILAKANKIDESDEHLIISEEIIDA